MGTIFCSHSPPWLKSPICVTIPLSPRYWRGCGVQASVQEQVLKFSVKREGGKICSIFVQSALLHSCHLTQSAAGGRLVLAQFSGDPIFSCIFTSSVQLKNENCLLTLSFLTFWNVLSPRLTNKRLCPQICATFSRKPLGAALFVVCAKILHLL